VAWTVDEARQLGAAVRRMRVARGLSQETLAFTAGVTKNTLQLLEAGRASGSKDDEGPSNPRLSTLAGLATVLNVSVSELLSEAGL